MNNDPICKSVIIALFFAMTSLLYSQNISGIINKYTKVVSIDALSNPTLLNVVSSSGFGVNDRVMIIQMKGATIDLTNSSNFGTIQSYGNAGNFEFTSIDWINGNSIILHNVLQRQYDPNEAVQLIRIPRYCSAVINNVLTAPEWDGQTGGVLALEATGTVTVSSDIDVSGKGFRRGDVSISNPMNTESDYYFSYASKKGGMKGEGITESQIDYEAGRGPLANGGGGGNAVNTGGGGGGNGGQGGQGGKQYIGSGNALVMGIGGNNLLYANNKIFLGGGGGGGHQNDNNGTSGAKGGGIIIIKANTLAGNMSIRANGADALTAGNDGAGGGGAGGTILLDVQNLTTPISIQAKGGKGGDVTNTYTPNHCHGPGGGGGGGIIWIRPSSVWPGVTTLLTGGNPGLILNNNTSCYNTSWGATGGNNGSILTNLDIPADPTSQQNLKIITGSDHLICHDSCVMLTANVIGGSPPYFYSWTPSKGLTNPHDAKPVACPDSTTHYLVSVTDINGCQAGGSITVVVHPEILLHAGNDTSICRGSSVQIGSVATGGTPPFSYQWSPAEGLISPNSATPIASPTSPTRYIVHVTNGDGCQATDSVMITLSLLAFNAGPDQEICGGTSVLIGEVAKDGTPPYKYLWNPSSGLNNPFIPKPIATPLISTKYDVAVTDANGCTIHDTIFVRVLKKPVVSIISRGPTTICEDSSVTLDATPGFLSYLWSTGESTQSITVNRQGIYSVTVADSAGCEATVNIVINVIAKPHPLIIAEGALKFCSGDSVILNAGSGFSSYKWSTGDSTQDIVVKKPGVYSVIVTNSTGCRGESDQVNVQVNSFPKPIITGPASVCQDADAAYSVSPFAGHTVSWTVIGGTLLTGSADETILVRWNSLDTGMVKVSVLVDSSGCKADTILHIRVNSGLSPVIQTNKTTFCIGDTTLLDAGTGYTNYLWSNGEKTRTIIVNQPGDYWVEVKDANGCSGKSPTVFITVNPLPAPKITALSSAIFCDGDSVKLDAGGGFITYKWNNVTDSLWKGKDERWNVIRTSGLYIVSVTDANGCVGVSQPIAVIVNPNPDPAIAGPRSICQNSVAAYSVNNFPNGKYDWTLKGGTILNGTGTDRINVQWDLSGIGVVEVKVTNNSTGCTSVSMDTILIGSSLNPIVTASGPTSFCPGDSVILDAGAGYASYKWNDGSANRFLIIRQAGSFSVAVTDSSGCSGTSQPIRVTVTPKPSPVLIGPSTVCINSTANYSIQNVPGATYNWTITGGTLTSGSSTNSITVLWGLPGTGTVNVRLTIGSVTCFGDTTISVIISSSLIPVITSNKSTTFCEGDSVTLDAGAGYATYLWNDSSVSQLLTVKQTGSYTVTVTDIGGCSGTSKPTVVTVNKPPVPAITPNGPVQFCEGDSVILNAGSGYKAYQWNTGITTQRMVTRVAGNYFVTVTDSNRCTGTSAPIAVAVFSLPRPVIVLQGSTLISTFSYASYQWNLNGIPIPNATDKSFDAIQAGDYTLTVVDGNGCRATSAPVAIGASMTSALGFPIIEAAPGEIVSIPLQLLSSQNLNQANSSDFTTTLRMNKNLLAPVDATPAGSFRNNDRIINISGKYQPLTSSLLTLSFMAMLGDTDRTPIHFEQFSWSDSRIKVTTQDGEFRLKICRQGGARLIDASGKLSLSQNRPNPYNASTAIDYEIIEKGRTQLFILDMLGRRVATLADAELNPGKYEVLYDATSLSSGIYFYVLQTQTKVLFKMMQVVK